MKHASLASFVFTIIVAVICAAWISHSKAKEATIQSLLASTSVIDQIAGIEIVAHEPFKDLVARLTPLLGGEPKVAKAASNAIVLSAFRDSCVDKLGGLRIDPALLDAARWWASSPIVVPTDPKQHELACDDEAAPWLRRLASLRCAELETKCIDSLTTMPLLDRDASVLLTTLAIQKHVDASSQQSIIRTWRTSVDIDRRKVAVLLQGVANSTAAPSDSDPKVETLTRILQGGDVSLAWRTLHRSDGSIDPDTAYAGLCVDRHKFLDILVETAREDRWQHPEHAVELARAYAPDVIQYLPNSFLADKESRMTWWSLVACGLLLEQR